MIADYDSYRVLAGRIRMHIMDWAGDDPPVVFLHGFTANGLAALPLSELIGDKRRLIAPDLRGRGQSDMPFAEYGLQVHVKDMIACMDRLGVEQFVVAGHSFGATIGLSLAAEYPERVAGLIMFDGGAIPEPAAVAYLDNYYDTLTYTYASMDEYVDRFRNAPLYQPWVPALERLVRSNLFAQPDGTFIRRVPRFVVDADRRSESLETWNQLLQLYESVRCPVLIVRAEMGISGKDDQILTDTALKKMQEGMPNAEIITVAGAGHTSVLTVPSADRDAAILRFLGTKA